MFFHDDNDRVHEDDKIGSRSLLYATMQHFHLNPHATNENPYDADHEYDDDEDDVFLNEDDDDYDDDDETESSSSQPSILSTPFISSRLRHDRRHEMMIRIVRSMRSMGMSSAHDMVDDDDDDDDIRLIRMSTIEQDLKFLQSRRHGRSKNAYDSSSCYSSSMVDDDEEEEEVDVQLESSTDPSMEEDKKPSRVWGQIPIHTEDHHPTSMMEIMMKEHEEEERRRKQRENERMRSSIGGNDRRRRRDDGGQRPRPSTHRHTQDTVGSRPSLLCPQLNTKKQDALEESSTASSSCHSQGRRHGNAPSNRAMRSPTSSCSTDYSRLCKFGSSCSKRHSNCGRAHHVDEWSPQECHHRNASTQHLTACHRLHVSKESKTEYLERVMDINGTFFHSNRDLYLKNFGMNNNKKKQHQHHHKKKKT